MNTRSLAAVERRDQLHTVFMRQVGGQKTVVIDLRNVQSFEELQALVLSRFECKTPISNISIWLKGRLLRSDTPLCNVMSPGDTLWIGNAAPLKGGSRSSSSDYDSNY